MTLEPRLDIIGAALADPSRARILCELMDGRAFTNKELACAAGITPQTASAHLRHLERAGLTASVRSGRHVYHRLAGAAVAEVLERLAHLSPVDHVTRHKGKAQDTLLARSCYNHLAGRLGVLIADRLIAMDVLRVEAEAVTPGARYLVFLADHGLCVPPVATAKPVAKLCLDWTERRHHLSGPFATALMAHAVQAGWLARRTGTRGLQITEAGQAAFEQMFGLTRADLVP